MIDLLTVAFLPIAVISVATVILLYLFILKPKIEEPLPNEHDEGLWRIGVPQEGMKEGKVCTARRYTQHKFSGLIEAASLGEKQALTTLRDSILKRHIFAQRVGRDKLMYFFNLNPLDEQFHMRADIQSRFGMNVPVRFLQHIQDCTNYGKSEDGFTYYSVTLRPEGGTFTEEETKLMEVENKKTDIFVAALKTMRLAAENKGQIKYLEERNKNLEAINEEERGKHAATRSKLDRALTALEQKTLSTTEETKIPGTFGKKIKEWFTWPQIIVALVGYFIVAPFTISYFLPDATPPMTNYITAGIALVAFFFIPLCKKLFGRWL